jgi:hypothetical protein
MDLAQIHEVALAYKDILSGKQYGTIEYGSHNEPPHDTDILSHCLWMCEQILDQKRNMSLDKAMRWLCFIQGCFWSLGIRSILDMKTDNRSREVSAGD